MGEMEARLSPKVHRAASLEYTAENQQIKGDPGSNKLVDKD